MHSDKRLLLVFAHPDDEFAVFPWIECAVREGSEVHAAWLTDGGWGGQDIGIRQRESVAVLESLGMRQDCMHFLGAQLGIEDGRLHASLGAATDALLELAAGMAATELMAPAWEGGHQDHDAAHLAACAVARRMRFPAWEYSLYHGRGLPGPLFTVLSLVPRGGIVEDMRTTPRQRWSYVRQCLRYRSQVKSFVGLLPFYALRLCRARAFKRRAISHEATALRPHEGRLLYERRAGLSWNEFAAATMAHRHDAEAGARQR